MIIIYLGILTVGIIAVVVILLNESKNSKPSPVDLLNSLEIDENPDDTPHETPKTAPSSPFLNRFNLNEEKPKKVEEPVIKPVDDVKISLAQSAEDFEQKLKTPDAPKPETQDLKSVDKQAPETNKPSSQET